MAWLSDGAVPAVMAGLFSRLEGIGSDARSMTGASGVAQGPAPPTIRSGRPQRRANSTGRAGREGLLASAGGCRPRDEAGPIAHAAQARKPSRIAFSFRSRPMKTTLRVALLARLPVALQVAVEDHVHALEDEALRLVREGHDALAAQDVRALDLGQVRDPRHELLRVDLAVDLHGDGLHVLVVMMVMAVLEEIRLDLEDAVEIEGVAVEHLGDRHGAVLRAMQLGIGVDGADARLDLLQLLLGRRDRSC